MIGGGGAGARPAEGRCAKARSWRQWDDRCPNYAEIPNRLLGFSPHRCVRIGRHRYESSKAEMRLQRTERADQNSRRRLGRHRAAAPALLLGPFAHRPFVADDMPHARARGRGDAAERVERAPHFVARRALPLGRAEIGAARATHPREIRCAQRIEAGAVEDRARNRRRPGASKAKSCRAEASASACRGRDRGARDGPLRRRWRGRRVRSRRDARAPASGRIRRFVSPAPLCVSRIPLRRRDVVALSRCRCSRRCRAARRRCRARAGICRSDRKTRAAPRTGVAPRVRAREWRARRRCCEARRRSEGDARRNKASRAGRASRSRRPH